LIEAIYHHIHYYSHHRIHTALKMPPLSLQPTLRTDSMTISRMRTSSDFMARGRISNPFKPRSKVRIFKPSGMFSAPMAWWRHKMVANIRLYHSLTMRSMITLMKCQGK
jgi:hypothetical protein